MFFCFAFILIVFLSLLPLLMPSATSDDVFPAPFSPSFHRLSFAYATPKVRLCYDYPLPHVRAYGFAKLRRKCHIVKFIFPQPRQKPFGKVYPRCRQGLGKVLAYSSHTQTGLLSMATLCHHYANTMRSAGEGYGQACPGRGLS